MSATLPHLVPDFLQAHMSRLSMAPPTQIFFVVEFYHLLDNLLEKGRLEKKQKLSKTADSGKTFSRENLVLNISWIQPLIFYLKELGGARVESN